jgi:hypothetical protein
MRYDQVLDLIASGKQVAQIHSVYTIDLQPYELPELALDIAIRWVAASHPRLMKSQAVLVFGNGNFLTPTECAEIVQTGRLPPLSRRAKAAMPGGPKRD